MKTEVHELNPTRTKKLKTLYLLVINNFGKFDDIRQRFKFIPFTLIIRAQHYEENEKKKNLDLNRSNSQLQNNLYKMYLCQVQCLIINHCSLFFFF